jgi:hypothetical protein
MNVLTDQIEAAEKRETEGKFRVEFWMKVAGVAFGLWAVMIPIGVLMLTSSVDKVIFTQSSFTVEFREYVLAMERRVTLLEERQAQVLKTLQEHKTKFETHQEKEKSK